MPRCVYELYIRRAVNAEGYARVNGKVTQGAEKDHICRKIA